MMTKKTAIKRLKRKQKPKVLQRAQKIIRQPFYSHIQELRSRLLWCLVTLILGSVLGYFLRDRILNLLIAPLHSSLFYTSPIGGFDFVLKISFMFGFLVSIPVIVYHILRFVEPAVPHHSRNLIIKSFVASTLLMLLGIAFAYYVSLPAALNFLGEFGSDKVKPLISTNEYLSFVSHYLIGFGVLFQLPLILVVLNKFYKLKVKNLLHLQRYVIVASFVIAAVITPTPDLVNQAIMAVPLLVLFYGSIILIYFINRKKKPVLRQINI